MHKFVAIKQMIDETGTTEVKAKKVEGSLNRALAQVLEEFFDVLKAKGLLTDEKNAANERDKFLGQIQYPDYPQL